MKTKPSQILIFTRPWEVMLHLGIAKELKKIYEGCPIRFVTFFTWAKEIVSEEGYEVIFVPTQLEPNYIPTTNEFSEIDDELNRCYGVNLNLLIQTERFLPRAEIEYEKFVNSHVGFINKLVCQNTVSISSMYDHFFYLLAGLLVNARNGCHFAYVGVSLPRNSVLCLKTPWESWKSTCINQAQTFEQARDSLKIPPDIRIEYMKNGVKNSIAERIRSKFYAVNYSRFDKVSGNYFIDFKWSELSLGWMKRYTRFAYKGFDINSSFELLEVKNIDFFYVPLHMEPEATILMYSPWLHSQIEMCRLCSMSLPNGHYLYVKENPKMMGVRLKSFYDELKKIPNLKLVATNVSSYDLIKQSKGVISLSGSACMEASIIGKPNVLFGKPPFRFIGNTFDFASPDGFRLSELNAWMSNPTPIDENRLLNFWNDWMKSTFEAKGVPRELYKNIPQVDFSPSNIHCYVSYMNSILN